MQRDRGVDLATSDLLLCQANFRFRPGAAFKLPVLPICLCSRGQLLSARVERERLFDANPERVDLVPRKFVHRVAAIIDSDFVLIHP